MKPSDRSDIARMPNTPKSIQATVEKLSGLSLKTLAEKCKSQPRDADGFFQPIDIAPGLRVVWVDNPTYQGGRQNGFGAGCYAKVGKVGYIRTELLAF